MEGEATALLNVHPLLLEEADAFEGALVREEAMNAITAAKKAISHENAPTTEIRKPFAMCVNVLDISRGTAAVLDPVIPRPATLVAKQDICSVIAMEFLRPKLATLAARQDICNVTAVRATAILRPVTLVAKLVIFSATVAKRRRELAMHVEEWVIELRIAAIATLVRSAPVRAGEVVVGTALVHVDPGPPTVASMWATWHTLSPGKS